MNNLSQKEREMLVNDYHAKLRNLYERETEIKILISTLDVNRDWERIRNLYLELENLHDDYSETLDELDKLYLA